MPDAVAAIAAKPLTLAFAAVAIPPRRLHDARRRFAATFAAEAPTAPALVAADTFSLFASGPTHWLAVSATLSGRGLEARLRDGLGDAALVTDQSDARTAWRIEGPRVRTLLEKGCALDLHPRVFPVGAAAVTEVAGIGAWLWRDDEDAFVLAVPTSYATSFAEWLDQAVAATAAA